MRARLSYMGRILRHTFPELEFDIDSLRSKAESLTEAEAPNQRFAEGTDSDIEGDLNIDDENCTINAVDDTIARRLEIRWRHVLLTSIPDYSGEFSYWNFSMRIKQHVRDWMMSSHTTVCLSSLSLSLTSVDI